MVAALQDIGKSAGLAGLSEHRLQRVSALAERHLQADARTAIGNYFGFYNDERSHQAASYRTPAEVYLSTPVEAGTGSLAESTRHDNPTAES
ncbi:MAG: hypothetical protein NTU41_09015 [Chloroflexi bacterium]|nr:hypothetical protein [Chloroflexota bacterium]